MFKIAEYKDDFREMYRNEPRKIIAYGAGKGLKDNFAQIPHIDIVCDARAEEIKEINDIPVINPEQLFKMKERIYIIICIRNEETYSDICSNIQKHELDAIVFHLFNNISFGYTYWATAKSYHAVFTPAKLRVNIVCQEESWIFKKFADRMFDNLIKQGAEMFVSPYVRADVDINHHIPYASYEPCRNDTLMITHVDNMKKVLLLKKQLQIAGMGICMSRETMEQLASYGIPRNKLCYINPAQDGKIKPHKYVIGITNRCYDGLDLRKRATAILDVIEGVNPDYFRFIIMGAGWDKIVSEMEKKGFEIEYYPEFIYDKYNMLMQQMDYFLYMGFDEGAMGYLDALAAGIGTIVTPQGYHLDVDCQIDYPCRTIKQFREAFLDLQSKREKKISSIREWTWENYSFKHLEIWNYLLKRVDLKELYCNQLFYEDGIYSTVLEDNRI